MVSPTFTSIKKKKKKTTKLGTLGVIVMIMAGISTFEEEQQRL